MLFVRHTCHLHDRGTVVPERDSNQGQRTTQNEVIELDINRGIERGGVIRGNKIKGPGTKFLVPKRIFIFACD